MCLSQLSLSTDKYEGKVKEQMEKIESAGRMNDQLAKTNQIQGLKIIELSTEISEKEKTIKHLNERVKDLGKLILLFR